MGISAGPDIITDGLVLELDAGDRNSYPGTGTTWRDLSGNSNNGTLTNGPTFNSGNLGSIVFDGVDDNVTITSNPVLTNQITAEFWVNLSAPTATYGWLFGRELSYRIIYKTTEIQWICATTNNSWYSPGTALVVTTSITSQITHIVANYDGTNNRLYINGTLISTGSNISGNILNNDTYYIMRDGSPDTNISFGKGNIYSHRIYNRALSTTEILQNYTAMKTRFGL